MSTNDANLAFNYYSLDARDGIKAEFFTSAHLIHHTTFD